MRAVQRVYRHLRNRIGLFVMWLFMKQNCRVIPMYTERFCEYPFVLTRLSIKEGKAADFGCKGSLLIPYLCTLGFIVVGFDLSTGIDNDFNQNYLGYVFKKENLCSISYQENYFDASFCISTIEHIFDMYGESLDKIVLNQIIIVTKPQRDIFLTMPYGAGVKSKGHLEYPYKIYNQESIKKLLHNMNVDVVEIAYYRKEYPIWRLCGREEIENLDNTYETKGTICLHLRKTK